MRIRTTILEWFVTTVILCTATAVIAAEGARPLVLRVLGTRALSDDRAAELLRESGFPSERAVRALRLDVEVLIAEPGSPVAFTP